MVYAYEYVLIRVYKISEEIEKLVGIIMAKMKTHSAAKKRFTKVGTKRSGIKIKRAKAYRRHLLTKKSAERKRNLRKTAYITSAEEKKLLCLLPD